MLPAFTVDDPWWPEMRPVIAAARERFGAEVVVLRMLDVVSETRNGGDVTYLAELVGEPPRDLPLTPAPANVNGEQPLRAAWARPGGVATTIAWADDALAAIGRRRVGPVVQIKTWNLSSILRLPTADGDVWCKSVPPFLAHEGGIIALVGDDDTTLVPPLLASEPATGTVLLGDVPGDDDWDASEGRLLTMVQTLVRLQARWTDRVDELLITGPARLADPIPHRARRGRRVTTGRPRAARGRRARALDALTGRLPDRFAALDACGIPETLVHGDFTGAIGVSTDTRSCSWTGATPASDTRCSTCPRSRRTCPTTFGYACERHGSMRGEASSPEPTPQWPPS
jgi:hypothetical protein